MTSPKLGIEDRRPALARSRPRSACRVGMRNAAPLMNTLAHVVEVSAMTSMDQRRAVPIDEIVMSASCHAIPKYRTCVSLFETYREWLVCPGDVEMGDLRGVGVRDGD